MKYKSEIYEVIHQSAVDKFEIGAISEARMREYNVMCLVPESAASAKSESARKIANSGEMEHTDFVTA